MSFKLVEPSGVEATQSTPDQPATEADWYLWFKCVIYPTCDMNEYVPFLINTLDTIVKWVFMLSSHL